METEFSPKVGMEILQTINGNTQNVGVITRVAGDMIWVRPATFAGKPNHRRSYGINRLFWATLTEA